MDEYINEFKQIEEEANKDIDSATSLEMIDQCFIKYLSKKGKVSQLMNKIREVQDKKSFGEAYNNLRKIVENKLNEIKTKLEKSKLDEELKKDFIDITLPGNHLVSTNINPFYKIIEEIESIFIGMGYTVESGPEVVKDKYNFELVNIPFDHPARDMQDSFFIDDTTLLRTHTSAIQAMVMEKSNGKPIKIICPGKCYRRDDDDMTHSHQFAQIEGLVIDKNIKLSDLKGTLELFAKSMFSKDSKVRFRSSFFPFTEPSVEVDISCFKCKGKGCPTCKGTGWIEILGAGMVHPNVLKMNGYDPEVYSGFAFGVGIERVAMLRYGIDDIRRFYYNDIKVINEFNKKVED